MVFNLLPATVILLILPCVALFRVLFTIQLFTAFKEYTIGIFPSIPFICHLPVSDSTTFLKQGYGEYICSLKNSIFSPAFISAFSISLMLWFQLYSLPLISALRSVYVPSFSVMISSRLS